MIVIKPVTIRAAQLSSSTIPYPDTGETLWNSGTTYAAGNTVAYEIDGLLHKFESRQGGNLNKIPKAYPDDADNAWWIDLGAVNRYNMFYLERSMQSAAASPLVVEIAAGERIGALAIGNIEAADSVRIEVTIGGSNVYDITQNLRTREVYSWYDWQYQPWRQMKSFIALDLPAHTGAIIKLTFTKGTGNVQPGKIVVGMPFSIGETEYKIRARGLNFTQAVRDRFGGVDITPIPSIPRTVQTVEIDKEKLNQTAGIINDLNGVITAWAGLSNPLDGYFDSAFVIGFYKETEYVIDNPKTSYLSIEIEGI